MLEKRLPPESVCYNKEIRGGKMRHLLHCIFWITVYLALSMSPLFALLAGVELPGRGFWREMSVGLGFAGLSMMGLQFFLTGRFPWITSPYGIDVVYSFHRIISLVAFSFIILHPAILCLSYPDTLLLLNPVAAPWWMTGGSVALLAFALLVVSSLYRQSLGLRYEQWRIIHGYVAVAAVLCALWHMIGVNYYLQENLNRYLWVAMATAWVLALVYVRLFKPLMLKRNPYRVEQVIMERGNCWTLALLPEKAGGINFRPGQFAWLTIGKSPFSITEHPFSFSSSAMHPEQLRFTIKELGDFTDTIGTVTPGTRVYVDGPYGTFSPDMHVAPGYVFVVGGVGVAPVISILRTFADRHDPRPLILFYGSLKWEDAIFREELDMLQGRLNLQVIHVVTNPPEGWKGERGCIDAGLIGRYLPEQRMDYQYFVCGSIPMQKGVSEALEKLGIPLEKVQSESFNYV